MSRAMSNSPSTSSQGQGQATSPRNTSQGSSFFDRFSRRPRTSGGTPIANNEAAPSSNESLNFLPPENSTSHSPSRRRPGGIIGSNNNSPSGLPRSSSTSHVHLDRDSRPQTSSNVPYSTSSGIGFPTSSSNLSCQSPQSPSGNRRSNLGIGNRSRPSTANAADVSTSEREREILAAGPGGNGGGMNSPNAVGGSNPFGRFIRRASQGAGKNNAAANEAHAIAAASYQNRVAAASQVSLGGSNSPEVPRRPTSNRAVTSPRPTSPSSNSNSLNLNSTSIQSNGLSPNDAVAASGLPNSQTLAVISDGQDSNPTSSDNPESSLSNRRSSNSNSPSRTNPAGVGGETEPDSSLLPSTANDEPTLHRIRLVPHLEASRSLHFEPIERNLAEGATAIKIGRFTDRAGPTTSNGNNNSNVNVAPATSVAGATDSQLEPAAAQVMSSFGGSGAQSAVNAPSVGNASGGSSGPTNNAAASGSGGRVESARVAFKSKVVSRGHAELWCEPGGKDVAVDLNARPQQKSDVRSPPQQIIDLQFFLRDTRSSSGTFLNHIRLSAPSVESRPFALKDGDVVQLGVDYQGGTEEIYRCVKMRVELNRGWQRGRNEFNVNAMRQIRALQGTGEKAEAAVASAAPAQRHSMSVTDCCICLFSVTVCQSLFIAPCSHVFHYKCIRPLLVMHHPGFSCPLCRTFADLEADVEQDEDWQQALAKENLAAEQPSTSAAIESVVSPSGAGEAENSAPSLAEAEAAGASQAATVLQAAEAQQSGEEITSLSPSSRDRREASEATARGSVLGVSSHVRGFTDWSRPDTAVSSSSASTARPGYFNSGTSGAAVVANHRLGNRISEGGNETPPSDSPNLPLEEEAEDEQEEELESPSDLASSSQRAPAGGSPSASSRPINIERSASNMTATDVGIRASSPMDESSTPMNQHFFSTLAETAIPLSRGATDKNSHQVTNRQAHHLRSTVGDTSNASNSSSRPDLNADRRGSETSNQDEAFHTGEYSPSSDSPLSDRQSHSSNVESFLGRHNQPLPRPPNGSDDHDLIEGTTPSAGKGKATDRRSPSSASSTSNRRSETNQEDCSKRDSTGSASGSAGSNQGGAGGKLISKFLKKAIN